MNERDSEAVAAMLRTRGYSMVNHETDADVILLNTCSVREQAELKAMGKAGNLLNQRKKKGKNQLIGIMGCMAQNRGTDILDSLPDLDLLIGTQKFHHVPDHLDAIIASRIGQGPQPSSITDLEAEAESQNTIREHLEGEAKVSAFVSIMQGCNMKCAFCIVPKTRGPERARPMQSIVDEVSELVAAGTREVTLLGQIVNQYGVREFPYVDGKSPFVQLLEKVNAIEGLERIRFTSPHPVGFREDLINCYGSLDKLCEYIHFPLQSGSNRILKAMRRPYTVERFCNIIAALRKRCPNITISTDVIVGFPGERDEDFEKTCEIFKEIGFEMAFIFKYSVRPGTQAEALGDPIPKEVKEERNQILLKILAENSLRSNQALLNTTQEVLIESPARKGENMFVGRNRGHRKFIFSANERLIGHIVPIHITEAKANHCIGEMLVTV